MNDYEDTNCERNLNLLVYKLFFDSAIGSVAAWFEFATEVPRVPSSTLNYFKIFFCSIMNLSSNSDWFGTSKSVNINYTRVLD